VLDDPRLSAKAKSVIADPANEIAISPASYWEIAIKVSTANCRSSSRWILLSSDKLPSIDSKFFRFSDCGSSVSGKTEKLGAEKLRKEEGRF
jgi:hypothetical protein